MKNEQIGEVMEGKEKKLETSRTANQYVTVSYSTVMLENEFNFISFATVQ